MTALAAAIVYGGTIAVSASPPTVNGYITGVGSSDVSTGSTVAAGSGGVAPYSYAWEQISVSPYGWAIGAPTAATTDFTVTALPQGVSDSATFEVTVTDAAGAIGRATVIATALNDTFDFRTIQLPF